MALSEAEWLELRKRYPGLRWHGGNAFSYRGYYGKSRLTGNYKRRSISFHADSKKAIDRGYRAAKGRVEDERKGVPSEGTMAELVHDWLILAERDRSPSTLKGYRYRAKLIAARFGPKLAAELTATHIDGWYTALMSDGKSASTIHEIHRVFSAILQFGVDKDRLPRAVTRQVTLPEHMRPDITPPTDDAMRAIFMRLPDVPWGRAVQLLAATGMRRGEVVGLRWDDWGDNIIKVRHSIVELPGGGVAVKEPKGKRTRDVTLGAVGAAILERQRGSTGPWVFGGNEAARPGWISLHWTRWRDANGAAGVRLHDLRHWYATHALESGASVASVAAQLGHAQTSTTTNIYHARTDAGRQQVAAAIDRGLMP
jgi:integrase